MFTRFMELLKRKNNKKGFTLVELMVVVVILGILVAIAVPVYKNVSGSAAENVDKANMRTINSAIMTWQTTPGNEGKTPTINDLVPGYLQEWPKRPNTFTGSYDIGTTSSGAIGCIIN